MYLTRSLEKIVSTASGFFPVVLVTGARQVGKTTLLRQMMESSGVQGYVSLDDPLRREMATSDPGLFMQNLKLPVLIDEIQYAPQILPYLKMQVDSSNASGQFWLTGSQQFHLMRGVTESLAGRVGIVRLSGLSLGEKLGDGDNCTPFLPGARQSSSRKFIPLPELYQHIWSGSYPRLFSRLWKRDDSGGLVFQGAQAEELHQIFYSEYVDTYLQRDVKDLAQIGNAHSFLRFLRVCAARTGQLLNYTELAKDAEVSPATARNWLSILEVSGIIHLLQPWAGNLTKRLTKTPKMYFLDTGLVAYLTGWTSPETLEKGAMSGAVFETWIISEILKSWWYSGKTAPVYFYRDKDGKEIDCLIERDGKLHPIEIKKSAAPGKNDIRHFSVLERLGCPVGESALICMYPDTLPLTEQCTIIPACLVSG